mmetsp:Transcript_29402/g.66928  ORF Transcript_29402/g.66928 Transcript_29402/m.66928 type:complete len:206 (+) Transcript_29402:33-650(+)
MRLLDLGEVIIDVLLFLRVNRRLRVAPVCRIFNRLVFGWRDLQREIEDHHRRSLLRASFQSMRANWFPARSAAREAPAALLRHIMGALRLRATQCAPVALRDEPARRSPEAIDTCVLLRSCFAVFRADAMHATHRAAVLRPGFSSWCISAKGLRMLRQVFGSWNAKTGILRQATHKANLVDDHLIRAVLEGWIGRSRLCRSDPQL